MHIAIDVTPGVASRAGIGRYAIELARRLIVCPRDDVFHPFSTQPQRLRDPGPLEQVPWIERPRAPRLLRAEVAARYAMGLSVDAWFGPCEVFHATDHVLPPLSRVASVFTLHDLVCFRAPETLTWPTRDYLRLMIGRFVRRADVVIAVSETTRRDAIELLAVPPEQVRVIPMTTPAGFAPRATDQVEEVRRRHGLPRRYLLSVGTLEPRKNQRVLFRALAEAPADLRLVVVGGRGWRADEALAPLRESAAIRDRVVFTGYVPAEDLPALYSGACGFFFPSLYEGFGTPVLEALACGTPVAASDRASLPEVLGDAGLLLPPDDVLAWRDVMVRFWESDPATWPKREAGFARARRFNLDDFAERTRAAYREAHARRA